MAKRQSKRVRSNETGRSSKAKGNRDKRKQQGAERQRKGTDSGRVRV